MSSETQGAINITQNSELSARIKGAVQELGTSCIELVLDAGNLQSNPSDGFSKRDLIDHARQVSEKVSNAKY